MNKIPAVPIPVKTSRDLLLFEQSNGELLVIGSDSSGGIGPKPLDKIKVDGYTLGKFTARAALMEVLSVGANVVCVVDALGVEAEPTGNEILRGIRDEAQKAGLDRKLAVTGSTEKNIAVEQTGIGVTVIGVCNKNQLKIGTAQAGDIVVVIGVPSVGNEVLPAEKEGKLAEIEDIQKLLNTDFIHEIIPVGSTGIAHEIATLAESSKLNYTLITPQMVDINKSAGPATAILAALPDQHLAELKQTINKPIISIAHLTA